MLPGNLYKGNAERLTARGVPAYEQTRAAGNARLRAVTLDVEHCLRGAVHVVTHIVAHRGGKLSGAKHAGMPF